MTLPIVPDNLQNLAVTRDYLVSLRNAIAGNEAGSALSKVDDTNITLTLSGSPSSALLEPVSLMLGWTGQLSVARGGTGQSTTLGAFNALSPLTTRGDLLTHDTTNNIRLGIGSSGQVLHSNGTDASWQNLIFSDLPSTITGAAFITIGNDPNLTGERALIGTTNQVNVTDNGANSTVVLSTPQNIHTTASPTFSALTLSGLTANSFLYIGIGGLLSTTTAPINGQLLIGVTGGAPTAGSITGSTGLSVTLGAGTIALANTGVTSLIAGSGISLSGGVGAVTITNTGDIASANLIGTANQIILSGSGLGVLVGSSNLTLSLPQSIATTSSPMFADLTLSNLTPGQILFPGEATYPVLTGSNSLTWNSSTNVLSADNAQFKGRPWVDVKAYGAVGDGIIDDTAAINAAIAAVPVGGGTVFFPAAVYAITGELLITTAYTQLLGTGKSSKIIATDIGVHNVVRINAANCLVRDLWLVSNGVAGATASSSCLSLQSANGSHIQDCIIDGALLGVYFNNSSSCVLIGCTVQNTQLNGDDVIMAFTSCDNIIANNQLISANKKLGIQITNGSTSDSCKRNLIIGNHIKNTNPNGVNGKAHALALNSESSPSQACSYNRIIGNYIEQISGMAIYVADGFDNTVIEGNICQNCMLTDTGGTLNDAVICVALTTPGGTQPPNYCVVVGNIIQGGGTAISYAIRVNQANSIVVKGNTISGFGGAPYIQVDSSNWTKIEGNSLDGCSADSININSTNGIVVSGNTCTNTGRGIIVRAGTIGAVVTNNRVHVASTNTGIYILGADCVVSGNSISSAGSPTYGMSITGNNCTVIGNDFQTWSSAAIDMEATGCVVTGNRNCKVIESGAANNNIYNGNQGFTSSTTIGTTNSLFVPSNANWGLNTSTPRRRLDILDASNPQLRLTYTDNTTYTDLQTDSSGTLIINPTNAFVKFTQNCIIAPVSDGTSALRFNNTGSSKGVLWLDTTNGRVTIGGTIPAAAYCHIQGDAGVVAQLRLQNTGATNPHVWDIGPEVGTSNVLALAYDVTNTAFRLGVSNTGGSVIVGVGNLATTATDGFIYIPTCSGVPTGVPTTHSSTVALVYDTANDQLNFYNGSWKKSVTSIIGTANQVIASSATGVVTLSLPQSLGTSSSPTFDVITVNDIIVTELVSGQLVFVGTEGSFSSALTGSSSLFWDNINLRQGLNTSTPRRRLDILDASNPQLRLTYTDNTTYTDLQTDSSGLCYIAPTGGSVIIGGTTAVGNQRVLQIQGTANAGFTINQSSASANNKFWDFNTAGGALTWRIVNDAQTIATNWLTVARSGTTVSTVTILGNMVAFGTAALATNATTGFPCTQSSAGAPTGVPASIPTGQVPWEYDTTNDQVNFYNGSWKAIAAGTSGLTRKFTATANVALNNSASETSMYGTGVGSQTLAANFMVAGTTIIGKINGFFTTGVTPQNLTVKIKLGTNVIASATFAPTTSATNLGFDIEFIITCRTTGASGTVIGQARVIFDSTSLTSSLVDFCVATATTTVDTTVTEKVDVTFTTALADSAATYTSTNATVETYT